MDWANERYVRLFIRDTVTWRRWSWQARAVFCLLLRKLDRAGVLDTGRDEKADALALIIDVPRDVAAVVLDEWVTSGTVVVRETALVLPNFLTAQETSQSDRMRQQQSRERKRRANVQNPEDARHEVSQPVTDGHKSSLQPSQTRPDQTDPDQPSQPSPAQPEAKKPRKAPSELTAVQRLQAFFAEERAEKLIAPVGELKGLGLPAVIEDDPVNWSRFTTTVNAWFALWPEETPEYQERFARQLISAYLDDPHWATATRWDRKGKDTGEPQPYPLRVLMAEKVWRGLYEKLERELDGASGGVH